jgi:hypothetical protein
MEDRKNMDDELEPYEPPQLVTLATVEDATLSTPETVGSDALLALSSF